MYLKMIGGVHVILAFLILLLLLLKVVRRRLLRVLVLGLLRWISVYSRTHCKNKVQGPICKKTEVLGGFWAKLRTKT